MAQTLDEGRCTSTRRCRRSGGAGTAATALSIGGSATPVVADLVVLCLPFTTLRDVDLDRSGL